MPAISAALIARLRAAADPAADRDLLRAFLADRSEPAFAALVSRHGPMVRGVCRRVLGNPHDADDAFQATFLVLARKANTVGRPDRLPGWLHTIAVRTATEVRRMRDRRRKIEASGGRQPPVEALEQGADAPCSPEQSELAALLDEELAKLPEHYRVPVVLCELQGLPRKDAAARLKLAEGTLSSRLAKARKLLADRLTHRGVTASTAAITAVLAREAMARVPADVAVESARAALTCAASAAAVHAADGVVKVLFLSKLKGLACAVGVVVACAGGVVALSGGSGRSAAAGVEEDADARKLVKQLGSPNFADREAAQKKLRALGARARPALKAGMTDPDPEVARRASAIWAAVRDDEMKAFVARFQADKDGTVAFDHPVWVRFAAVAGDDKASRRLFAAMIGDPTRARLLARVVDGPTRAGQVYEAEVLRLSDRVMASQKPGMAGNPLALGEFVGVLFLGTFDGTGFRRDPAADRSTDTREPLLFNTSPDWVEVAAGPSGKPARRLIAAWLGQRGSPPATEFLLDQFVITDFPELLPVVRRIAADKNWPMGCRSAAIQHLARYGGKAELPAIAAFFDAKEEVFKGVQFPGGAMTVQARDVAVRATLQLHDQDPADFGFPPTAALGYAHLKNGWKQASPGLKYSRLVSGFFADADREAAHKKAREFLDKQPKPEPKPDPEAEKLVKQLGSPNFADREAAGKKLREMGAKARPALLAGAKDADPEIARRCASIMKAIRADEQKAFVAGMSELNNPVWKRFKELVGDTKAARNLYLQMIDDYRRATLLTEAETSPAKAAEVYVAEVVRVTDASRKAFQPFVGRPIPALGTVDNPMRDASRKAVPLGDAVAVLFLGARPLPDGAKDPSASFVLRASFADGVVGPLKEPLRKLFAAWLDRRRDPETIHEGLMTALLAGVPDALPTARRLAADPKLPAPAKDRALLVIGNHGTKDDLPLLTACRADARVSSTYKTVRNEVYDTQVRDVAAAMALHLYGQDFEKYGFEGTQWQVWWLPSNPAPFNGISQFK
ncbi:MAG TPA: sigma-70 family RNA polymerase sigma factor, partial [Fimbriiglobus sp.]|nr:sigma-70 family RNA polymerase sigma factor [Fimbriiglobus sp.]